MMIDGKWNILTLLAFSLSACSQDAIVEKDRLKNDDAFAREVISELASARDAALMEKLGSSIDTLGGRGIFSEIRKQMPQGAPVVIKFDKSTQRIYNFQRSTEMIYFYSVGNNTTRIAISLDRANEKPRLLNINVQKMPSKQ
jgi:hypothetical protein